MGHENTVLELYNDPGGNCSVGIGHLVHLGQCDGRESEIPFQNGISQEQAEDLFRRDLDETAGYVRYYVQVPLTQYEFDALTSFAFNVGPGNFGASSVLGRVNQGDYGSVPDEMNRYVLDTNGTTQPGSVTRRQQEGTIFRDGIYP